MALSTSVSELSWDTWYLDHNLSMPPSETMLTNGGNSKLPILVTSCDGAFTVCCKVLGDRGSERSIDHVKRVNWKALGFKKSMKLPGPWPLSIPTCAAWWKDAESFLLSSFTSKCSPMHIFGSEEFGSPLASVLPYVKSLVLSLWVVTPWWPFPRGHLRLSGKTDIHITIHNSSKIVVTE